MIKVITFGVFDLLHYGHINLFKRSKRYGDHLIVAVQEDKYVVKNKPNVKLYNNLSKRMSDVKSVEYVDEVVSYRQIDLEIKLVDFDVLIVGEDQKNEHFIKAIEWCVAKNKQVIRLARTPNISSSELRKEKKS